MAHAPTTVSNVSPMPVLGTGWHFPIAREGSPDGTTGRLVKLATASDEISVRQSIEIILSTSKAAGRISPRFRIT